MEILDEKFDERFDGLQSFFQNRHLKWCEQVLSLKDLPKTMRNSIAALFSEFNQVHYTGMHFENTIKVFDILKFTLKSICKYMRRKELGEDCTDELERFHDGWEQVRAIWSMLALEGQFSGSSPEGLVMLEAKALDSEGEVEFMEIIDPQHLFALVFKDWMENNPSLVFQNTAEFYARAYAIDFTEYERSLETIGRMQPKLAELRKIFAARTEAFMVYASDALLKAEIDREVIPEDEVIEQDLEYDHRIIMRIGGNSCDVTRYCEIGEWKSRRLQDVMHTCFRNSAAAWRGISFIEKINYQKRADYLAGYWTSIVGLTLYQMGLRRILLPQDCDHVFRGFKTQYDVLILSNMIPEDEREVWRKRAIVEANILRGKAEERNYPRAYGGESVVLEFVEKSTRILEEILGLDNMDMVAMKKTLGLPGCFGHWTTESTFFKEEASNEMVVD